MCDSSDSKINTAEAKALVTASQELYSELLEQLQQKLGGTRAARSKISRETHSTLETTPTVKTSNYKSASYELDDYSQYEDVDPSEVIVAEKFVRIRKLIVTGKFNDKNEVATVETVFTSNSTKSQNFKDGISYLVVPLGYVDRVEWGEYHENQKLMVEASFVRCTDMCRLTVLNTTEKAETRYGEMRYSISITNTDVMLNFESEKGANLTISTIQIIGTESTGTQANYTVNNQLQKVEMIEAPKSISREGYKNEYLIFNNQTKNIICEKEAPISYLFCVFDLTDRQVASRQLVFERNYEGKSRGDSGRKKRGLLELLKPEVILRQITRRSLLRNK